MVKDGPAAHFATLPIKACVAEMRKAGLPAAVSNTAGTFVCNHIFYALMDIAQGHPIPMRGGFLHIPYVPEQAARLGGAPSMALDDIVRGIEIVLSVSAARQTGGPTSVTAAQAERSGRSRRINDPFVRMENGFAASRSASRIPGISRYRPSARW